MSVISKTRSALMATLTVAALCGSSGSVLSCAAFGGHGQSTVAQGKYYSSGDPRYDEFFIGLYMWQVAMEQAPRTPETERQNLARLLELPPEATTSGLAEDLREEALKLSRAGVHLRLDHEPSRDKPEEARAVLRASSRPAESAKLFLQLETSGSNLLRSVAEMKLGEQALSSLETMTIRLDADVDTAFAQARFGKQSEVKKNLADAHKIISLMRARVIQVQASSEELLGALTKAVNTDDGSLGPPTAGDAASLPLLTEAGKAPDPAKKAAAKPHPKAIAAGAPPAARPKPAPPLIRPKSGPEIEGDAPTKAKAPAAKPAPAARDFEP
jgi:hypothetical protein